MELFLQFYIYNSIDFAFAILDFNKLWEEKKQEKEKIWDIQQMTPHHV